MKVFQVHSSRLRMDSTQIASDIRETSRLQLLVEVLQRVARMWRKQTAVLCRHPGAVCARERWSVLVPPAHRREHTARLK